jgi:hypothetical protein
MARSYHVTKKAARLALAKGNAKPTNKAQEKSWTKEMVKMERVASRRFSEQKRSITRSVPNWAKDRKILDPKVRFGFRVAGGRRRRGSAFGS